MCAATKSTEIGVGFAIEKMEIISQSKFADHIK